MDQSTLYLGIDYGGNAVKMGLVDRFGQLSGSTSRPTANLTGKTECRAFASEVADFVHGMGVYSSELGGVGLAIPGIVEPDRFLTPNVHTDWPLLLDSLAKAFSKPFVAATNDANAAVLGELWMGAGANYQSALLVTLGSGIGSGLVVNGRVIAGGHGAAGELGHMTVVPDGRLCKCGRHGCLERYASARGLVQTFREATEEGNFDPSLFCDIMPAHDTDALAVFKAARAGDPRALFALDDMAEKLGFALAQAACVMDPAVILLGGGLSRASDLYLDSVREVYKEKAFAACKGTDILCATLLADAGVIGAARFAMISDPDEERKRDIFDPEYEL